MYVHVLYNFVLYTRSIILYMVGGGKGKVLVLHTGTKKSNSVHYMPWGT